MASASSSLGVGTRLSSFLSTSCLNLILVTGWLFGCIATSVPPTFPYRSGLGGSGSGTRTGSFWKTQISLVSCILTILNGVFITDYTLVLLGYQRQDTLSKATTGTTQTVLSMYVINCAFQYWHYIKDVSRRGFALCQQRHLLGVLDILTDLDSYNAQQSQYKDRGHLLLVCTTLLNMLLGITKIISSANELQGFQTVLFGFNIPLGKGLSAILIGSAFAASFFTKHSIPLLGEKLARKFESEVGSFIIQSKASLVAQNRNQNQNQGKSCQVGMAGHEKVQKLAVAAAALAINAEEFDSEEFKRRFQKLGKCFEHYNKFIGCQILVTFLSSIVLIVWYLFRIVQGRRRVQGQNSGGGKGYLALLSFLLLQEALNIWMIGHTGEVIREKINSSKQQVKTLLAELTWCPERPGFFVNVGPDSRVTAAKEILGWKWRLNACGLFNVDHENLSSVLATILTLVIFMFQIRVAEDPTPG